ncbi:MAG: hypothetical protein K0Q50_541 [Vampirovibrio sp.]|jgi:hypothetical protein|nr:hypothetical protein [Vampirovibrio sp.]
MTSRRVTPLLLAASIFLTGATGAFVGSMTSAHAITSVDELTDVNQNHWAYEALRDLVEKYDVIEGYPDHTFRGERNATRWELAAALNALIKSVGRDLARLGAEKADKSDLETLAKLQEEFKNELAALQARTEALESRASAIEAKNAEQDQRLSLLERTQIHGDASIGVLGDLNGRGTRDQFSAPGSGRDGILNGISAIGRVRLTMDIPVKEDKEDSKIGAGEIHTRLIGAFGRLAPNGVNQGGAGPANPFNGYSRIAGDASLNNEGLNAATGLAGVTGGSNTRSTLYIEDIHYHQHFKAGIPLLTDWTFGAGASDNWQTTGDLYVGSMPWRYLYDKSPYRGNEQTQFQNNAFVNTPGVAINQNYPMIAYQWHQQLGSDSLSADFTTGVGSINVGDMMDGFNLTYEGRLNYKVADLPGNIYAGGYNIWGMGNTVNSATLLAGRVNRSGTVSRAFGGRDSTNALYAGWNQEWYKGIGTTINYMYSSGGVWNYGYLTNNQNLGVNSATVRVAPGDFDPVTVAGRQSITGVLNIPMSVFGIRENDVFGIGYSVIQLRQDRIGDNFPRATRFHQAWEQTAEAYYKWAVNDAISIIPSVQVISNSLGVRENGINTVVGLRTSYSF